jgi:hypothetical protein
MRMGSVGYWRDIVCNSESPYNSIYARGSRGRTSDVSHILYAESLCISLSVGVLVDRVLDFVGLCILRDMGHSSDMMTGHSNSH